MSSYREKKFEKASMGAYGYKLIKDASATTPATGYIFSAIQAITDIVIAETVEANSSEDLVGLTIFAGSVPIYGRFTSVTLTSGTAIVYNGV